jgi:hypothetical protein
MGRESLCRLLGDVVNTRLELTRYFAIAAFGVNALIMLAPIYLTHPKRHFLFSVTL